MADTTPLSPSGSGAGSPPSHEPPQEPLEAFVTKMFIGRDGIRAGWRVLIFVAAVFILDTLATLIELSLGFRAVLHPQPTAQFILLTDGPFFSVVLLASWAMSKLERRRVSDYGLPWRNAFRGRFWQGALIGFAAVTALLAGMHLIGAFQFGVIGLRGPAAIKYAAIWGGGFLVVGLFEEFAFRGYPLFTLTTGIGFWPAAIIVCACFGLVHHSNAGESWVGVLTAGLVGLLFCLLLRRTGDLWMPIGFHAAWDWAQSYFYGVPDSGSVSPGHLFNAHFSGPVWLTGGTVGPEGSWLCVALLIVLLVIFAFTLRGAKYPDSETLVPRTRAESVPPLFPTSS
ncbi:MAG TPA: CPBP family intramembrane glutamic endopeptidase [Candidatus Acidoferrum sp.]|nr:CPBP family intramembrane glutamic endopeptidase [Candidatus Acidoferrum sp.]